MEWKAYRVAAPSGNGAMTLICYNLNASPRHQQVQATIKKKIILFGTVLRKCLPPPKNACCFIIGNHKGRRTIRQQYIRTYRIYRQTVSSLPHTERMGSHWHTGKVSVPGHRPNYLFNREPLGAKRTMYRYTKSMDRKFRQARTEKYFHRYPQKL